MNPELGTYPVLTTDEEIRTRLSQASLINNHARVVQYSESFDGLSNLRFNFTQIEFDRGNKKVRAIDGTLTF